MNKRLKKSLYTPIKARNKHKIIKNKINTILLRYILSRFLLYLFIWLH